MVVAVQQSLTLSEKIYLVCVKLMSVYVMDTKYYPLFNRLQV